MFQGQKWVAFSVSRCLIVFIFDLVDSGGASLDDEPPRGHHPFPLRTADEVPDTYWVAHLQERYVPRDFVVLFLTSWLADSRRTDFPPSGLSGIESAVPLPVVPESGTDLQ